MSNSLEEAVRESAKKPRIKLVRAADVQPECVSWLWEGWLPYGKLASIVGEAGVGKSTLVIDLIARATRGGPMPGDSRTFEPITVLIAGVEDGWADTIRPRLDAAGADPERVLFVTVPSDTLTLPGDLEELHTIAKQSNAKWLHIDSIMGTLAGEVNAYRDHEVRRALNPLKDLAERWGLVITYISHPRKQAASAVNVGGGSVAFGALARVLLLAGFDPTDDNPDPNERRRVLAVAKSNLARTPTSRTFQVVAGANQLAGCIRWGDTSTVSADDLAWAPEAGGRARHSAEGGSGSRAKAFLLEHLSNGVRHKRETLVALAADAEIPWSTIEKAATALGVSRPRGGFQGGTVWYLPRLPLDDPSEEPDQAPFPPTPAHVASNGGNGGNGEEAPLCTFRVLDRYDRLSEKASFQAADFDEAKLEMQRRGFSLSSHKLRRA